MKSITVFYNIATDIEIMELLAELGVREFSKFPRTSGKGLVSGPRLDDHVWPGYNATLVMVVADAEARKIMSALQKFRDGPIGHTGIFAYQTAVESVLAAPAPNGKNP